MKMPLRRRIYQQGNSLVVSIPLWMLEEIGVKRGDVVQMLVVRKKKITIERFTERKREGNGDGRS